MPSAGSGRFLGDRGMRGEGILMSRGSRLAVALALACAGASIARAEEQPQAPARPVRPRGEQMRENQRKLDELVARMNAATGEVKVDAIAAVLNELVAQRKEMMSVGGMGAPMGRMGSPMRPGAKPPTE